MRPILRLPEHLRRKKDQPMPFGLSVEIVDADGKTTVFDKFYPDVASRQVAKHAYMKEGAAKYRIVKEFVRNVAPNR